MLAVQAVQININFFLYFIFNRLLLLLGAHFFSYFRWTNNTHKQSTTIIKMEKFKLFKWKFYFAMIMMMMMMSKQKFIFCLKNVFGIFMALVIMCFFWPSIHPSIVVFVLLFLSCFPRDIQCWNLHTHRLFAFLFFWNQDFVLGSRIS